MDPAPLTDGFTSRRILQVNLSTKMNTAFVVFKTDPQMSTTAASLKEWSKAKAALQCRLLHTHGRYSHTVL